MIHPDSASPATDADNTPGLVLRAYANDELSRAIDCLSWPGAQRHAGVHLARKSMRRVRAALALGAAALGPGARLVDRQVRRVNRSLSTVRDCQALVEALERLRTQQPGEAREQLLKRARRAAVRQRVARMQAEIRDDPAFLRRRAVLEVLLAGMQALPWTSVLESDLAAAFERGASDAQAARDRAAKSGRDEDWHRWRRRVRRLSQQHRAVGELGAGLVTASNRYKTLAVLLGEAQDHALLIAHCGSRSPFDDADRPALKTLARKGLKRTGARIGKAVARLDGSGS